MSDDKLTKALEYINLCSRDLDSPALSECGCFFRDEIERLRARVEELEQQKSELEACCENTYENIRAYLDSGGGVVFVTHKQIDKAWRHANTHVETESKLVEFALNELGIFRDGDTWRVE